MIIWRITYRPLVPMGEAIGYVHGLDPTTRILRTWTGPTSRFIAEYTYDSFAAFQTEYSEWQDSRPHGFWDEFNQKVVVENSEFLETV